VRSQLDSGIDLRMDGIIMVGLCRRGSTHVARQEGREKLGSHRTTLIPSEGLALVTFHWAPFPKVLSLLNFATLGDQASNI
jgi:hypothetical protein